MMTVYNFVVKDPEGRDITLEKYRGKVLLIVNTASKGLEGANLKALQKLYDEYAGRPFEILAFPCRQFLSLESKNSKKIPLKYKRKFGVTFPVFGRVKVNGKQASPLYKWLTNERMKSRNSRVEWNFVKFLVESDGITTKKFAPSKKMSKVKRHVEAAVVRCETNDYPVPFNFDATNSKTFIDDEDINEAQASQTDDEPTVSETATESISDSSDDDNAGYKEERFFEL